MSDYYEVYGAVPYGNPDEQTGRCKAQWVRIGTGNVNRDGSINVYLNFLPARPDISIQLRRPLVPTQEKQSSDPTPVKTALVPPRRTRKPYTKCSPEELKRRQMRGE